LKLEFDSKVAQVNGGAQQIIDDESLTVAQRKQKAKDYVDAFDDANLAEFTPKEKKAARKELVSLFDNAEKARITELKEARLVDLETQYTNLSEYDDTILNSTVIKPKEKVAAINKLRIEGKIPEEDAKLRITYLNSVDKLTATTKPPIYNQLVQQSYDVLQIEDPEMQLEGFKQIENAMLEAQTRGDVDFRTAESWRTQFRNLTQSAKAKSSAELYDNMIDAQEIIDAMIPVSMRGEGVRYLWENAEPRIAEENATRAEAKRPPLRGKEIERIYKDEAQNAVDDIRNRMATRAKNLVGTSSPPPVARVVLTSQAQYNALPVGTAFTLDGVFGTKK
jgi:vacuolar-type H+-ATPase subunit I/STV1